LNEFEKSIKEYLSNKTYKHALGVKDTAIKLSEIYGCSKEKAETASLLHDIARDIPLSNMRQILKESGFWSSSHSPVVEDPLLLHAYAGKIIAKQRFGTQDEEVLKSIELHTTGGESMSVLDKVIFVADFIEPGRAFYGVEKARILAYKNLDKTVLYIYKFILRHLLSRELFICKNTLLGYNEIIMKM